MLEIVEVKSMNRELTDEASRVKMYILFKAKGYIEVYGWSYTVDLIRTFVNGDAIVE